MDTKAIDKIVMGEWNICIISEYGPTDYMLNRLGKMSL